MVVPIIATPSSLCVFGGSNKLNNKLYTRPDQVSVTCSRREALLMSMGMMTVGTDAANGVSVIPREQLLGPEIPPEIAAVFDKYVFRIQDAIGPDFNARLVIYGVTSRMPYGSPGDPSKQYGKDRKSCGQFHPPAATGGEPYDICSTSSSSIAVACCRHYAYCVPYDRFPASPGDSVSAVVVSSRVFKLPMDTIQGILVHELGHAIDFHMFGKRYRLQNRSCKFASEDVEASLSHIDSSVSDPEYRADLFANAIALQSNEEALCYNTHSLTQTIVRGANINCSSVPDLMDHYSHEPLQGMRRVVI